MIDKDLNFWAIDFYLYLRATARLQGRLSV